MLNLANIGKTWDVTLPDGVTTLHINKPTQGQLIKFYKMADKLNNKQTNELEILNELVKFILNNNKENKIIDTAYILDNFIIDHLYAIFEGYMQFVIEIQSDPN